MLRTLIAATLATFASVCAHAAVECSPDKRLDIAALPHRVVVVAESTHGTREAPAFVAGLLCNFARARLPVILAWAQRDLPGWRVIAPVISWR